MLHIPALVMPAPGFLPPVSAVEGYLHTLWQVSAATVGFAIVFVILTLETTRRGIQGSYLWQHFLEVTRYQPVVAFLFLSLLAIGLDALLLLLRLPIAGASSLLLLDVALFTVSVLLLLRLFGTVSSFLRPGFVDNLLNELLTSATRDAFHDLIHGRGNSYTRRSRCRRKPRRVGSLGGAYAL
ncbi:MAG TPA: hypothetical protein VFG86_00460 [Chloroflexota bacterium]|nr:hypothetical protein [Chloroflexota bacterium]